MTLFGVDDAAALSLSLLLQKYIFIFKLFFELWRDDVRVCMKCICGHIGEAEGRLA